ncbi:MAG: hypothetical protein ACYDIA_15140 [Candidatus Humimicrobiaceae bacterium]
MTRGIFFGNFIPLMILTRIVPFALFAILAVLTIIFWVIYGVNKFKWAKITAIVLSAVLGLFFIGGIALSMLRGFIMLVSRDMMKGFFGFNHSIRRF